MFLPVKVLTPFSWTETEGVKGGAGEEVVGLAVAGVMLADGGRGGGAEVEGEKENGRSGKRALERGVVVEMLETTVGREAMEGLAEGAESGEEVEGGAGEAEAELELNKSSGGREVGRKEEVGEEPLSVGESEEGKAASGKSASMRP